MHTDSTTCEARCPQVSKKPDFHMTCRRCGGRFLETVTLLFHRCGQPAKAKPKRRKAAKMRKNRAGVARA